MKRKHLPVRRTIMEAARTAVSLFLLIRFRELFFGRSLMANAKVIPPLEFQRRWVFFALVLLTILTFFDGIRSLLKEDPAKKYTVFSSGRRAAAWMLATLGLAVLSFFQIEFINNYYMFTMMKAQYFVLNIAITYVLYLVVLFLTDSVKIGLCAGEVFFITWGSVNYFVQKFRGIPFQWIDFGSIGTAATVSGNYEYTPNWEMIAGIVIAIDVCSLILHRNAGAVMGKLRGQILSRVIGAAALLAFVGVIFHTNLLADTGIWLRDWQPWYTYRLFGMESGFFAFAKASYPTAPESYSKERVEEIIEESEEEDSVDTAGNEVPENIICIMNESFSDLTIYPGFTASTSLMPTIKNLTENTQQGRLLVSVKGGTTANTEYEFLTGNSCVLSPTTVVYNSFIKQNQYTLARVLTAQGYRAVALHPYGSHGWNRDTVYPRMGFETFLNTDNWFQNAETVRGFVSDRADYEELIRQVEEKEPGEKLFLFNITMQNHSSYKDPSLENTVDILNYDGENKEQAEQYCTLIRLSDAAVGELIEYFSASDEKTLICFWGDHQPEIGDDFWEYCFGKDLDDLTFDEQQMQYETRWFIWANYDIPEVENLTLSANDLGSYLMSQTGLTLSGYEQYVLGMRDVIPAMNAYGYLDEEGKAHQWDTDDVSEEAAQKLEDYKCLIYNELTAGDSRDETFFAVDSN